MSELVGRRLGRYEVVALIGRGGMGEVYRARDTELGREVAMKVLPEETAGEGSRLDRFKREARAVARLSHPNILEIHDFGTDNGVTYSITELLEGSDLRERLRGHPLPVSRVVRIGREVAEGLAAAHGKGIVHRDIKPANIFITGTGQVKILDFGIAGLKGDRVPVSASSETETKTLTQVGQVIGTASYMSPEQTSGKPADARSDIFSLGCVLYEMLTGQKAFDGENARETIVAIVSQDPVPVTELRPDVPTSLDLLIRRCLEKEPAERFESARDVAFALEALSDERSQSRPQDRTRPVRMDRRLIAGLWGAAAVIVAMLAWNLGKAWLPLTPKIPENKFVAVVDFNASEDDEALIGIADGLTETVTDSLRLLERQTHGSLWVVPRRFRKPDQPWTLASVAANHGITIGLEGRLGFASDGRLRLELELREPGSSRPLRTSVIEDHFDNVVTFQREPLERVAAMLDVNLDPGTRALLEESTTTVVPALASYLNGIGRLVRAREGDEVAAAQELLEDAVAKDPTFSKARAALIRSCGVMVAIGSADTLSVECRQSVAELVPAGDADIAAAVASTYRATADHEAAVGHMRRATELRDDDSELHLQLGKDLLAFGEAPEAANAFHRAVDLRFDYWEGYYYLGFADYVQGNYEATANAWRIAARRAPERSNLFSNLGAVFHFLDRTADATSMFERAIELSDRRDGVALSNLGTLYFEGGRYAEAVATFQKALGIDDTDYRIWGYLAWSYAAGVDPDRAVEPFERAAELAEEALVESPENPDLLAALAGYHGMLGNRERGYELIDRAIGLEPQNPDVMVAIGESLEDLGDRDRALHWIGEALERGARQSRIESHPSLRDLVADERYQRIAADLRDRSE